MTRLSSGTPRRPWPVELPSDSSAKLPIGQPSPYALPGGPTRPGPWSSLRLEAHREGFEDHELLKQLQDKDPSKADAVIAKAIKSFDRYVKDVKKFRAARKALLEELTRAISRSRKRPKRGRPRKH